MHKPYLTHKELVERLKTVKEVLAENESAVTPELLEAIDMVIEMMRPADNLMKDIDDIFKSMFDGGMDYGNDKKWGLTFSRYSFKISI